MRPACLYNINITNVLHSNRPRGLVAFARLLPANRGERRPCSHSTLYLLYSVEELMSLAGLLPLLRENEHYQELLVNLGNAFAAPSRVQAGSLPDATVPYLLASV